MFTFNLILWEVVKLIRMNSFVVSRTTMYD